MRTTIAVFSVFVAAAAFPGPVKAGYAITDLGTLGGNESAAFGGNAFGQVVGSSLTAGGQTHACLYSGGTMIDLGLLSPVDNYSEATRINDFGQIVGYSAIQDSNGYVHSDAPFLFANGSLSNVGSLGGGYGMANDINNAGQIVGISADVNGVTDAFLAIGGVFTDLGRFANAYPHSDAFGVNASGRSCGFLPRAAGPRAQGHRRRPLCACTRISGLAAFFQRLFPGLNLIQQLTATPWFGDESVGAGCDRQSPVSRIIQGRDHDHVERIAEDPLAQHLT